MATFSITPILHILLDKDDPVIAPENLAIGDSTPAITVHVRRKGRRRVDMYTIRRNGTFDHDVASRGNCGCN